jgi:hypothetical protein
MTIPLIHGRSGPVVERYVEEGRRLPDFVSRRFARDQPGWQITSCRRPNARTRHGVPIAKPAERSQAPEIVMLGTSRAGADAPRA